MAGASIEETLELWASSLRAVKARMRPLFLQERMAASAGSFLEGLLGGERRKIGWSRAEAAGDPGPWRQQAILGRAQWDADALRDVVRDSALETLADADAVLVIDETGFLKQGKASCGVGRQSTGSAGKITNCQVGVFAAYASRHGHAFVDRALYLPKAWTDDPARMAAAHVPDEVRFATKPKLAVAMIERAIAAEMPFAWVAADTVYGTGDVEMALRRAGTVGGLLDLNRANSMVREYLFQLGGAGLMTVRPEAELTASQCDLLEGALRSLYDESLAVVRSRQGHVYRIAAALRRVRYLDAAEIAALLRFDRAAFRRTVEANYERLDAAWGEAQALDPRQRMAA